MLGYNYKKWENMPCAKFPVFTDFKRIHDVLCGRTCPSPFLCVGFSQGFKMLALGFKNGGYWW